MERAEAGGGPGGGTDGTVTRADRQASSCTGCGGPIAADWRACPECGAALGRAGVRGEPPQSASALPSVDTGEVAFVPVLGGARRPITFVEVGPTPSAGPSVPLSSLVVHGAETDRIPPEPLNEPARKPVTVVHEAEMEAPLELPEKAQRPDPVAAAPATTLAPTVLVLSRESGAPRRLDRADMAEIERMIGEAVDRAIRQNLALQAPPQAALLPAPDGAQLSARNRVLGVGAGLVLGGSLADLLVLNWDVWVRGDLASAIGWLQQTGVIGMAALAGAGAAALILMAPRGGRRAARVR